MVARGQPEEVNAAVDELTRYFGWVRGNFFPGGAGKDLPTIAKSSGHRGKA